ncbi:4-hydroxy-tetrahydrodipicolinate reductase [bacterium]|nr:MAG: 4-hydroxy-tetrahydrodipicolinate reductase [bacterium]
MIKVAVTGGAGRMGSLIAGLVTDTAGLRLGAVLEREGHPSVDRDAGEMFGASVAGIKVSDDVAKAMEECDVLIDFTSAEVSMKNIRAVTLAGKAIVVGSTGFTPDQKREISSLPGARVFLAANMSVGMNVLFRLVNEAAKLLGDDFDVEIVETHHRFKKDSPSGSALRLAEAVASALKRDPESDFVYGREGIVGERTKKEIGIHAVRAGDVVGDHTVIFGALGERLELTHKASSRETFARGAIRAALWIPGQKPGVYEMLDLLGLK